MSVSAILDMRYPLFVNRDKREVTDFALAHIYKNARQITGIQGNVQPCQ